MPSWAGSGHEGPSEMSGEITIDEDSFEGWKGMMDAINPMKVKLNFLLLGIPVALYAKFGLHDAGLTFLASMVAIMPLAFLMGKATEEIALRTSESIGGLLNATLQAATLLFIASLGELITEKSGILNLGVERGLNMELGSMIKIWFMNYLRK